MSKRERLELVKHSADRQRIEALEAEEARLIALAIQGAETEAQRARRKAIPWQIEAIRRRLEGNPCDGYEERITVCNHYNNK